MWIGTPFNIAASVIMLSFFAVPLLFLILSFFSAALPSSNDVLPKAVSVVNQTNCDGKQYSYQSLAGYGLIPSNARDKTGDTIGGIGSSVAIDRSSWKKTKDGSYTGILYAIPDRGW